MSSNVLNAKEQAALEEAKQLGIHAERCEKCQGVMSFKLIEPRWQGYSHFASTEERWTCQRCGNVQSYWPC